MNKKFKRPKQKSIREMKFSPTTQLHDIKHKLRFVEQFLDDGEKVRLSVRFSGREVTFPETGQKLLQSVCDLIPGVIVDKQPDLQGKVMAMIICRKRPPQKDKPNATGQKDK